MSMKSEAVWTLEGCNGGVWSLIGAWADRESCVAAAVKMRIEGLRVRSWLPEAGWRSDPDAHFV